MRPTISVNLGGTQFIFNDNAYKLMSEYLKSLNDAFRAQNLDADELTADIENRCAEILTESHNNVAHYIISYYDVEALIDRLGRPEEILEIEPNSASEADKKTNAAEQPSSYAVPKPVHKRLYRLYKGSDLGGVCGGIAAYFGWDPTYVRLATVALAFISCSTVAIAYLIMWIVIPAAKTPFQEMELRGESPTLNNIGNKVKKIFGQDDTKNHTHVAPYENLTNPSRGYRVATGTNRFFSILAKITMGIAALLCVLMTVAIIGMLVMGIVHGISELSYNRMLPEYYFTKMGLLMCSIIIVGIPLSLVAWFMIRALFQHGKQWSLSPTRRLALFIAWTISVFLAIRLSHFIPQFPDTDFF